MFSSIRWRFITIYFLLVFIAMSIVGVFIVDRTQTQQINTVLGNMERQIESIIEGSSYIGEDYWDEFEPEIQETLNEWRLGSGQVLYIIHDKDVPTIIASTSKQYKNLIGQNALASKYIEPMLVLDAYRGKKTTDEIKELNENIVNQHLAYPVISELGKIKGIIYMTTDLSNAHKTIKDSKVILTNATLLALGITVFLGFLIASSITNPIRDLTIKAEEMASGDFDQFVDIKSNDEIGQLGNMFNYLTLELKHRIQEIDFERSKLETIFTYMAEGVVAVNRQGEIIHANITAMNILNLNKDYLKKKQKLDFSLLGLDYIDYNNYETLEGSHISASGDEIYKMQHAPFKNKGEHDAIGGIIIVFQDITKEHKLDNMRKEFVANVSHELKTPITTIKSYTETLMDQDIDQDMRNKFLSIIDSESDRMNRLVQDLLKLSNLDYKKTKWNKIELDVNELIDEVLYKLDYSIKDKKLKIDLNLDFNIPRIYVDKDGYEQVLLNIISNAIKYNDEEGIIRVESLYNHENVIVKVKDSGPGMEEEDLKRIFERFYRVEKGRSRELGGTGLGLSIAKEIIEAHNGSLNMESELGKGSIVTISIPTVTIT